MRWAEEGVINGLALCMGALIGGFLLGRLPPLFGYGIFTLLLISSSMRLAVAVFVPFRIKEVRAVKDISDNDLFFSAMGIKSLEI